MSAAGGGEAQLAIPPSRTIALGVIGGLIGIYATPLNPIIRPITCFIRSSMCHSMGS